MARDGGLRKIYRENLPEFHWTSVESPFTVQGIPDSNYCRSGVEGWIENKRIRSGDKVEMRKEQVAWSERRVRAGGRVFIGVRWQARRDTFYLLQPQAGRLLLATGLLAIPTSLILCICPNGPKRWEWPKIAEILTSL